MRRKDPSDQRVKQSRLEDDTDDQDSINLEALCLAKALRHTLFFIHPFETRNSDSSPSRVQKHGHLDQDPAHGEREAGVFRRAVEEGLSRKGVGAPTTESREASYLFQ